MERIIRVKHEWNGIKPYYMRQEPETGRYVARDKDGKELQGVTAEFYYNNRERFIVLDAKAAASELNKNYCHRNDAANYGLATKQIADEYSIEIKPVEGITFQPITKRFYAACKAMQAMVGSEELRIKIIEDCRGKDITEEEAIAKYAYGYADELIKQGKE